MPPQNDGLISASGSGGSASFPTSASGTALSAHHELQLLREQLEQQSQQTQAALAQLQLAREQLAAEQVFHNIVIVAYYLTLLCIKEC